MGRGQFVGPGMGRAQFVRSGVSRQDQQVPAAPSRLAQGHGERLPAVHPPLWGQEPHTPEVFPSQPVPTAGFPLSPGRNPHRGHLAWDHVQPGVQSLQLQPVPSAAAAQPRPEVPLGLGRFGAVLWGQGSLGSPALCSGLGSLPCPCELSLGFVPLCPRLDSEGVDLLTNLLLVSAGAGGGRRGLGQGRAPHPAGMGRGAQRCAQKCPDGFCVCTGVPRCEV